MGKELKVTKEIINQIIYYIEKGYTLSETTPFLKAAYDISDYHILKCVKAMRDEKSEFYNLELVEKLKMNAEMKKQYAQHIGEKRYPKNKNYFLQEMEKLPEEEKKIPQKSLLNCSKGIQKEIILLALTYRVSVESLAVLFNTTKSDVLKLFYQFNDLKNSLIGLCKETASESEKAKKESYYKAFKYWAKRIKIEKEGDKEKLKEWRENINNAKIIRIMSKSWGQLTEEEKETAARFRLKYYLSLSACLELLHFRKDLMMNFEEQLAEKDEIYAERLSKLNDYNKFLSKASCTANINNLQIQNQINQGVVPTSKITEDYFHINQHHKEQEAPEEINKIKRG